MNTTTLPLNPGRASQPAISAPALLPSIAIVDKTILAARRAVLLCLLGASALVAVVLAERSWLLREGEQLTAKLSEAEQMAGKILLADEQLTTATLLAATTGDMSWVDRYDAKLPVIDQAIARAMALAPAEAAYRFDTETKLANDKLVVLERSAFDAVRRGELASAQATLDSPAYAQHKQVLSEGTERFTASMVGSVNAELEALRQRADVALLVISALVIIASFGMWRRLDGSLARSRGFFVDAQSMASSDMLTGLANRVSLRDALGALTQAAPPAAPPLTLLMLDLDRFKPVNDRLGHAVGDAVLKTVALRMSRLLREGELVARWGGDEFVVLIPGCDDEPAGMAIAERLIRAISQPMVVAGHAVEISATVGMARFPHDAKVVEDLLQRADLALYRAKSQRRGSTVAWSADMDGQAVSQGDLTQDLRRAIAAGEIVPFYQPIVRLADRKVQTLEILARWQHPQRGLLPPSEFIAQAESCGAIGALTQAVLRQACLDARAFAPDVRLSINVAAAQLEDLRLVDELLAVLHETGLDPRRLEVELTEYALVRDVASARHVVGLLSQAGITIALDDFGTGYSSLAYLSELPVDKVKIDRSFVRSLHEGTTSAKIIASIVGLSRSLGVEVVAEGVETETDAQAVAKLGCQAAQGYLFARPMPAAMLMRSEPTRAAEPA